ncbi:MAG: dihydroorotase, partial [Candidatus Staskawiczbacteria bacterium]|nr:dihydroorotase [Candidatus Staskawiczbacteria bacterium]
VYPIGVTTNSQNGVQDFKRIYGVLEAMQECGMLLLLHGESPKPEVFCMEREKKFHSTLISIAEKFPDLKIVLEHITTSDSVDIVKMFDNVAATITIHHLMITLDDVVGGMLSPHHFCKPIAKRPQDRMALREAAFSGSPKFFYGGDSAPHLKEKKECACGCAGVFNAPVALPLLVQLFEEFCRLDLLENFASTFGARFYGLPRNTKRIQLVKQDWTVPSEYSGIVPFMAGKTLHWKMAD